MDKSLKSNVSNSRNFNSGTIANNIDTNNEEYQRTISELFTSAQRISSSDKRKLVEGSKHSMENNDGDSYNNIYFQNNDIAIKQVVQDKNLVRRIVEHDEQLHKEVKELLKEDKPCQEELSNSNENVRDCD